MKILKIIIIVIICLLLIPVAAVATVATKQRFEDGPNRVFSGGPLVAGELYSGPEPDWSFVNNIRTIEMQLLDPPTSRRIWVIEHGGKLYVWSGYMGNPIGRIWKQWPKQAERDGRAVIRIDGIRYERKLKRLLSGDVPDGLAEAISSKYTTLTTQAGIEAGNVWAFEVAPR